MRIRINSFIKPTNSWKPGSALLIIFFALATPAFSMPLAVSDKAYGFALKQEYAQLQLDHELGNISYARAKDDSLRVLSRAYSRHDVYFKNMFPEGFRLDPLRNDISKIINNLLSSNENNWHGYDRELKYINTAVAPRNHLELIEAGRRERTRAGRLVEFDSYFRDLRTQETLVIEIKDKKITRGNLSETKDQISKISQLAREDGVTWVKWINRKEIPQHLRADLIDHAIRHNVVIADNITTGMKTAESGRARALDFALEHESHRVASSGMRRAAKFGFFVTTAVETGFVGYDAYKWRSGRINTRDFSISLGRASGGIAGGAAGAVTGFWAGSALPGWGNLAGAFVGGVAGAISGDFVGRETTSYAVDKFYYEKQSDKEKEATLAALIAHYEAIAGN